MFSDQDEQKMAQVGNQGEFDQSNRNDDRWRKE